MLARRRSRRRLGLRASTPEASCARSARPRPARPRRQPLPHGEAAERADPREGQETRTPHRISRQAAVEERAVETVDAEGAGRHVEVTGAGVAIEHGRAAEILARRGSRVPRISARLATSRRLRFRPWAPIGAMACAASPASAMRRPVRRSAREMTDREAPDRARPTVIRPSSMPLCRSIVAREIAPGGKPGGGRRPRATCPRRGSTDAARPRTAGSGTSVNGPWRVWNSVETP